MSGLADDLLEMHQRVRKIKDTFGNIGTIEAEDLEFLCNRALGHVAMMHIAENDWVALKTLQVTSTLEIEDLVRQLGEK